MKSYAGGEDWINFEDSSMYAINAVPLLRLILRDLERHDFLSFSLTVEEVEELARLGRMPPMGEI